MVLRRMGELYQADFYLFGVRIRKSFDTLDKAIEFKNSFEKAFKSQLTTILEAERLFFSLYSKPRKTKRVLAQERYTLWEFRNYLKRTHGLCDKSRLSLIKPLYVQGFQFYLAQERPRTISNSTVNRKMNTIQSFFSRCLEWGFIELHPMYHLRALPEDQTDRHAWTDRELLALRGALHEADKPVFDFLLSTGARVSSAEKLLWGDLDLEAGVMRLSHRKGRDGALTSYQVPLSVTAREILTAQGPRPKGKVFPGLSAQTFSKRCQRVIKRIGFERPLTLHGLRHTFASRLHKRGASTESIRRLLGHSNTKTTQGYLHADMTDLRRWV